MRRSVPATQGMPNRMTWLHGAAWCCMVLHGAAWCCMVLHGAAWCCMVLHGATLIVFSWTWGMWEGPEMGRGAWRRTCGLLTETLDREVWLDLTLWKGFEHKVGDFCSNSDFISRKMCLKNPGLGEFRSFIMASSSTFASSIRHDSSWFVLFLPGLVVALGLRELRPASGWLQLLLSDQCLRRSQSMAVGIVALWSGRCRRAVLYGEDETSGWKIRYVYVNLIVHVITHTYHIYIYIIHMFSIHI